MSARHPIIAVTGSSGAGTTTVSRTFDWIFRHENIRAARIEGDAFHRYTRAEMRQLAQTAEQAGRAGPNHFSPEANLLDELDSVFARYGENGTGIHRHYLHDEIDAARFGQPPRHLHRVAGAPRTHRPAVLRRPARRRGDRPD